MSIFNKSFLISLLIHGCILFLFSILYRDPGHGKWKIKLAPGFQSFAFQLQDYKIVEPEGEDLQDSIENSDKAAAHSSGVQSKMNEGIKNPQPKYPPIALKWGWEGTVHLKIQIKPTGETGEVQILRSSSYTILDNAATAAVKQWKFPPSKNKKPVYKEVKIEFKIKK